MKNIFCILHPQKQINLHIKEKNVLQAQASKAIFLLFSNSLAVPEIPLHSLEKGTDRRPSFLNTDFHYTRAPEFAHLSVCNCI